MFRLYRKRCNTPYGITANLVGTQHIPISYKIISLHHDMSSIGSELRYHSRKEGDVSSSLQAIDCAWEVAGDDNSLVNQQVLYFSGFFPKKTK